MQYPLFITIGPLYGTKVMFNFRKLLLSENHVAKIKISLRLKVLAPFGLENSDFR